jgi:stage II sporulation protein P
LQEILEENPSLQVILDIHRDGVAEDKRLVTTIDGRPTAKLMFFNGLSYTKTEGELTGLKNPYIQENLAFSFQTEYLCDYYYPSLSRCIYLKAYRYNLDLLPRSMLVEVGAQTNTVQEAKNAMLCLARVLDKLLQGA